MSETDHLSPPDLPPNHHRDYPGFSGASGLLAALSMSAGRDDDAALAARLTSLAGGDRVVDIGCGPGRAARLAASRGAVVVAVDPAPVMLRVARLLARHAAGIDWRIGAAEALPLDDGAADVAWSLSAVHHWDDVERGVQEAWRVLRPGGRFLAVEHAVAPGAGGLASHGWTDAQAEAFADTCRAAGFTEVGVSHDPTLRRPAVAVRARRPER